MNSVADVWQVVLERLRAGGLAETAISTWFDEVEAVAIRDMTFYLCCPNDFKRGTIESLFLPNLKTALKEIFSADFDVKLLSVGERDAFGQEKPKKPTSLLESGEFTFDTFVVGDSNKLAYAAARAVADAPAEHYNPLFIYGDSGLGKTHLIYAIAHEIRTKTPNAKIVYIKGDDFTNELVEAIRTGKNVEFRSKYRDADLLLMDDVHCRPQADAGGVLPYLQHPLRVQAPDRPHLRPFAQGDAAARRPSSDPLRVGPARRRPAARF